MQSVAGVAQANQDLRDLINAAREVVDASMLSFSLAEAGERVCLMQELAAVVDAGSVGVAMAGDDYSVGPGHGLRTTAQFVASRTNVDPSAVRRDIRIGRWLRDFPEFEDAFNAGVLKRSHVAKLREVDSPRTHGDLVRDQAILIAAGRDCSFRDFGTALSYWLIANDPDGAEPKEQASKVGLTYRRNVDGSVEGKFYFAELMATAFEAAIGAEVQKQYRCDVESDTRRTSRRLNADALINLMTKGAARADGTFSAPLINIVMSQKVAEDTIARLTESSDEPLPVSFSDVDERCELIDGTPIHPHFALAAMSVGRFQRHVFDQVGRVVETSQSRAFPEWMKNILRIQSRGKCKTIGCDAPFHWLHADHVKAHSRGGPTSLDNGEMRCGPDNMFKGDGDGFAAA